MVDSGIWAHTIWILDRADAQNFVLVKLLTALQ